MKRTDLCPCPENVYQCLYICTTEQDLRVLHYALKKVIEERAAVVIERSKQNDLASLDSAMTAYNMVIHTYLHFFDKYKEYNPGCDEPKPQYIVRE